MKEATLWRKIAAGYIRQGHSMKALAKEYGISRQQISKRANAEDWKRQREEHHQKVLERAMDKAVDDDANDLIRLGELGVRLMDKIEKAMEQIDLVVVSGKVTVKEDLRDPETLKVVGERRTVTETADAVHLDIIDRDGVKALAAAMRDLKTVLTPVTMTEVSLKKAQTAAEEKKLAEDPKEENVEVLIHTDVAAEELTQ